MAVPSLACTMACRAFLPQLQLWLLQHTRRKDGFKHILQQETSTSEVDLSDHSGSSEIGFFRRHHTRLYLETEPTPATTSEDDLSVIVYGRFSNKLDDETFEDGRLEERLEDTTFRQGYDADLPQTSILTKQAIVLVNVGIVGYNRTHRRGFVVACL
jgi:hypothetical protein